MGIIGWTSEKREISALLLDGGLKVNFSMPEDEYAEWVPKIKANCQRYVAKVKFLNQSKTGLRFPILREIIAAQEAGI